MQNKTFILFYSSSKYTSVFTILAIPHRHPSLKRISNPLSACAYVKNALEFAKFLITENSALLNASYSGCPTPLYCDVLGKKKSLIQFLLEKGADPNIKAIDGSTAWHQCVKNKEITDILNTYSKPEFFSKKLCVEDICSDVSDDSDDLVFPMDSDDDD